jgi:hypothetical protein
VRYALVAYVASWIAVLCVTLGAWLVGVRHWGVAGALWFDVAWLVSLVPLYRAGVLRTVDLGMCTSMLVGFERALTGRSPVVFWSFAVLVLVLVARSLRWRMEKLSR